MRAGIRCFVSCCFAALVAAPAYAGGDTLPVTVKAAGPHKPQPEVEPHLTTAAVASASGSDVPTLAFAAGMAADAQVKPRPDTPDGGERGGTSACRDMVYDNGSYNFTNALGSEGWVEVGIMDDVALPGGGEFSCVQVAMRELDPSMSAMRIQVFDLNDVAQDGGSQGDGTLAGAGSYATAVPVCDNTYTVGGGDLVVTFSGDDSHGDPINLYDATGAKCVLPPGDYGVALFFPSWTFEDIYWELAPDNETERIVRWGPGRDLPDQTSSDYQAVHLKLLQGLTCGDGICEGADNCCSCEADCGPCSCGDGTCNGPCEDCGKCEADCGACPPCLDAEGDCCDPAGNGSTACDDSDCCETVCALDPACCELEWDDTCAALAADYCLLCFNPPEGLITCSVNKEIVPGSVACAVEVTLANQYARCFDAANFPADTTALSLDFGLEIATADYGGPMEVIGTLYSIPAAFCGGDVMPDWELTVLGSGSITLIGDGSESGTIQAISFGYGIAVPAGTNVVAEIAYEEGNRLWPGSNPNGQTCPSYISSDDCGLRDLTDLASIGFPDMHLVLNLTLGEAECGDGVCEVFEDCCNCPDDCGDCQCGDGTCGDPCEDCQNCEADCGPCPVCGGPVAGACCDPAGNGSPGCHDIDCCENVCALDPACCEVEWDEKCADAAAEICLFASDVLYSAGNSPISIVIGDLDGDGDADLAVANRYTYNVSVLLNNGDGTFAAGVFYRVGDLPYSVAIGDLDGDGDADLAVANFDTDNVSVLLNNGDGTFAAEVLGGAGDGPVSVAIGDLNGDGDADLAVANWASGNVSVLLNEGNGTFATDAIYGAGNSPFSVAIADLDGDGDADLAVANVLGDNVAVLLNDGDGTFAADVLYGTGDSPLSLAIDDLDGDGDADIAVANRYDDSVSVLLNNGDGTFAADVTYGAGNNPSSVAIADLDGDGDADLAVANRYHDNVSVLMNSGDGTFAAAVLYGAGNEPWSVAIGDLDGNGDADLAVANEYTNNVSVLLNQCPAACGEPDAGNCCDPDAGDCCDPAGNGSPGCDDSDCCETVCALDPACCKGEWNDTCAVLAADNCLFCSNTPEDLITCSVDKEIVPGSIACSAEITTENQFARCFDTANFPADTTVRSLDFGIEIARQLAQPIEVIGTLYSISGSLCGGDVMPDAELTVLGSGSITLVGDGSEDGTIQTIMFDGGIVVPAGTNVVAEFGYLQNNIVYPGSNPNGQTCPSYISTDSCGLPDLTDLTLIGFPDMHLVLNLNTGGGFLCPDGICGGAETCCSCDEDCGPCACGDGVCNDPCENEGNCPEDCAPPATCDDDPSLCDGTECVNGVCDRQNPDADENGCVFTDQGAGTPCGDDSDTECDNPDACDGAGNCVDNKEAPGEPCDDGDECTSDDRCTADNDCVGEYQEQHYADICLVYCPPSCPQPDLDDILCVIDDFADGPAVEGCTCNGFRKTTDLHPCAEDGGGDGALGLDDVLNMLDAFAGLGPCPDQCP